MEKSSLLFFILFPVVLCRTAPIQITQCCWDEWGGRTTYTELTRAVNSATYFPFLGLQILQYSALNYLHHEQENHANLFATLWQSFWKESKTLRASLGTSLHFYLSWQYLNFWFVWIYDFERCQRELMSHWTKILKPTAASLRHNALT